VITAPGYFVWSPTRRLPQCRHDTYEQAVAEAQRLAAANPGEGFFTCGAFERFKRPKPDADREKVQLPIQVDDWIPF
jgi:hypothetical protein